MAKKKEENLVPVGVMTAKRVKEFEEYDGEVVEAQGRVGILRRLLNFAVNIAISRAKANDPDFDEEGARQEVEEAITAIGDGKIWEWLMNGGFEMVLEWIMTIIGLFGSRKKS